MTEIKTFAKSSQGLPVFSYVFGEKGPVVLILAGVHGDEPEGNYIAWGLLQKFLKNFPYKLRLTLVPAFNVEGSLLCERTNGNAVDLNRNLPTKNWTEKFEKKRYYPGTKAGSEPENQALIRWIDKNKPKLIISLHSWNPMINVNGNCEPEAGILSEMTKYKVTEHIGYPTPGSLGDYCGMERGIPVITYEAARGGDIQEALNLHVPAIEKALFASEKR